jgi:hypothetical protein
MRVHGALAAAVTALLLTVPLAGAQAKIYA